MVKWGKHLEGIALLPDLKTSSELLLHIYIQPGHKLSLSAFGGADLLVLGFKRDLQNKGLIEPCDHTQDAVSNPTAVRVTPSGADLAERLMQETEHYAKQHADRKNDRFADQLRSRKEGRRFWIRILIDAIIAAGGFSVGVITQHHLMVLEWFRGLF